MRRGQITGLVLAALALAPSSARTDAVAGTLVPRYVFSGAVDSGEQTANAGTGATTVHCTNFGSTGSLVEVTVRNWNGTPYSGLLFLSPSQTATYSTHLTAAFANEFSLGAATINQGSGIISAEGSDIVCTAMVLDPSAARPLYMSRLPLHPLGGELFSDGFESGDTSAWDSTVD